MRVRSFALATMLGVVCCTTVRPAWAGPPATPADDDPEALFERSMPLMEEGQYAQACPLLARSQELDAQLGTKLHLAYCLENLGKTATARSLWLEAAAEAEAKHEPDRASYARQRATALQPFVVHVTVVVAEQPEVERIGVQLDGADLPKDRWGSPQAVDPGPHWVQASAEGRRPWSAKVDADDQHTPVITVPVLMGDEEPGTRYAPWSPRRTAALVMGGIGLAALVGGTALAVAAKTTFNGCQFCQSSDLHAQSTAYAEANGATVTMVGGSAALLGAALLWLTAPARVDQVRVGPTVGRSALGLSLDAKW